MFLRSRSKIDGGTSTIVGRKRMRRYGFLLDDNRRLTAVRVFVAEFDCEMYQSFVALCDRQIFTFKVESIDDGTDCLN